MKVRIRIEEWAEFEVDTEHPDFSVWYLENPKTGLIDKHLVNLPELIRAAEDKGDLSINDAPLELEDEVNRIFKWITPHQRILRIVEAE